MAAWYRAGTVAVTNGSTTVTGTGTAFNANINVNDAFWGPDGKPYEIAAIVSDTVLTLATAYLGSTSSGQTYQIQPTRGVTVSQRDAVQALIEDYEGVVVGAGAGVFPVGSNAAPSLRATTDTNTGVNFLASDVISLVAGGTERGQVTTTGLNAMAIGATTPAAGSFTTLEIAATLPSVRLQSEAGPYAEISSNLQGDLILALDPTNIGANTNFAIEVDGGVLASLTDFGWAVPGIYSGSSAGTLNICGGENNLNNGTNLAMYGSAHASAGDFLFRSSTQNTFSYDQSAASFLFFNGAGVQSVVITPAAIYPQTDGAITLGTGSKRFGQVYSTIGTISTSDARLKTPVEPVSEADVSAANVILDGIGSFQYLESVAEKGENARKHIGVTVQAMIAALEAEGIDPFEYGFVCYDEWDEIPATEDAPVTPAGNRYSARYDQIAMFLIAALNARTKGFEARLAAIETNMQSGST